MRSSLLRVAAAGLVICALGVSMGCGKRPVASVNGEKITQDVFYKRLQRYPVDPRVPFPPRIDQQAASVVLNQLIMEQLLLDLAKKEGVSPTKEQIDERKKELNGALGDRGSNLQELLTNQAGMTHKELDERLKPEIAQINIIQKYVKVPDSRIRKEYETATKLPADKQYMSMFFLPEAAKVSGIVCKTKDKIMQAKKDLDNGVSFSVTSAKYSDDPNTKQSRGVIGWIPRPDKARPAAQNVPPQIYQVALSTKVGDVSAPFQAAGEWVILKVDQRREPHMQPFDHVKGVIRDRIIQFEGSKNKKVAELFQNLRKNAKVDVSMPDYKAFFKNYWLQMQKTAPGVGGITTAGTPAQPGTTGTQTPGGTQ